jgi:hypothetical protein
LPVPRTECLPSARRCWRYDATLDAVRHPTPASEPRFRGPLAFEGLEKGDGGVVRASVLETGQYGRALFAHGIQLGRIQSENLEDRRSDLCRLDEGGDGTRLERRIGY